jgi:hypothetical protein
MEMDKADVPTSFGVFKPVGHTMISVRSSDLLKTAVAAFREKGFAASSLVEYTPQEMMARVDSDLLSASPLAEIGQDVNLAKAHWDLAESGCSFLIVYAPERDQQVIVDGIIETLKPVTAQRYGRFVIEELISTLPGVHQLPESPETGLNVSSAKGSG